MSTENADRRKFLRYGLRGGAAAAAASIALPGGSVSAKSPKPKTRKKVITTGGGKGPLAGILSPGIQYGTLLFVSGQGAQDPATHKVVPGPFQNQARQCLENVKAVLVAANSSLDRVLKCTVFLTDIANYQAMNQIYHTYFPTDPPSRSTIAVRDLPGGSLIEIECIAYVG